MPTPLDAFGAQIRPSRKRVVNRGCAIEDNGLVHTEHHAAMIASEMTTPYQPSSTSCTPCANGSSWLEPAAAIQIGKARFPPNSAVRAYTVRVGFEANLADPTNGR